MSGSNPPPLKLFEKLLDLDQGYGAAIEQVVSMYPAYASAPGAPGAAELYTEDSAELQKAQADLFLYRDHLEAASGELARSIAKEEEIITKFDTRDKKLSTRLSALDTQVGGAEGRLRDAVYLYEEGYLANLLLAAVVLGGVYTTYKSIKAVSAK